MYFSKVEFETALKGIDDRINRITCVLDKYGSSRLVCRTKNSNLYYTEHNGNGEIGITKNRERIHALLKCEYLRCQLNTLRQNRKLIENCCNKFVEITSEEIISDLSHKYSALPVRDILLNRSNDWSKQPYQKNPYYQDDLKYITSGGLLVRSKSEREIANGLEEAAVEFRHDALIDCGDVHHYADFLIRRPDGTFLIWEHFGREHDRQYMAKNRERIKDYINIGFKPWDNLVWTLESDLKDPKTIKMIIKRFILCDMNSTDPVY